MILKKTTFMNVGMIKNAYNNIAGLKFDESDGYNYIDYILEDLEYAYQQEHEDYLMNLLTDEALKEIIKISEDWDIMRNDYPIGNYKKIEGDLNG